MLRLGTTPRRSDGQAQAGRAAAGGEGGGAPEAPGGDGAAEAQWSRARRRGARDVAVAPGRGRRGRGSSRIPWGARTASGTTSRTTTTPGTSSTTTWMTTSTTSPVRSTLLQDRIRAVVAETVERRDPEVARRVRRRGRPTTRPSPFRGDRTLIDLFVASWLLKARRRRSDPDLARRAVTWVGEHLGETAPVVADAARVLGPAAAEASRENFLRTPPDVLVARIWLLAAVVAPGPGARPRADRPPERRRRRPPTRPGAPVTRGTSPDPGDTPGPGR